MTLWFFSGRRLYTSILIVGRLPWSGFSYVILMSLIGPRSLRLVNLMRAITLCLMRIAYNRLVILSRGFTLERVFRADRLLRILVKARSLSTTYCGKTVTQLLFQGWLSSLFIFRILRNYRFRWLTIFSVYRKLKPRPSPFPGSIRF